MTSRRLQPCVDLHIRRRHAFRKAAKEAGILLSLQRMLGTKILYFGGNLVSNQRLDLCSGVALNSSSLQSQRHAEEGSNRARHPSRLCESFGTLVLSDSVDSIATVQGEFPGIFAGT